MPADALLALQASVTKTASFNGASVQLVGGSGFKARLMARFLYSAATNASGSNTATFGVDISYDNSTWYSDFVGADTAVSLTTTAKSGEIHIPIVVNENAIAGSVYVRAVVVIAGAGSTPTITYSADIVMDTTA